MKRNIKLLSTISVAAALAGSTIFVMNNNQEDNSTVQAASITLPSGYTKNAAINWNQTGKASKALINASKRA